MNKFFFIFRFSYKKQVLVCYIAFILIPCFSEFAFSVEGGPVNNIIIQSPDILKAFIPCFGRSSMDVTKNKISSTLEVMFQKQQSVKHLSARDSVLITSVNGKRKTGSYDYSENSEASSRNDIEEFFHILKFQIIGGIAGLVIGSLIVIAWLELFG